MLEISKYEELELLLKDFSWADSKQKQAVQALWENKFRFDILLEQSQAFIWEVDIEGLFIDLGSTAERILGYRTEELIGNMHFYDLHPDEGREAFKAAAFEVFSRKEIFRDLENRIQTKSGEVIWVGTSGIPILDAQGNLTGYWGMDLNITKRKRAEHKRLTNMHRSGQSCHSGNE
jgi:PAS domain S-box-containing protein